MDVASEIEALERQGWEALSGPDGATFYDEAMADDGLMLFPGMAMDKADSLSAMRTVAPWSWFELEDIRVIAVGPDGAVITYRARAERDGEPVYEAMMSSVYARRAGRWQLVLHQQSPI